jgi:CBS domain-containing protein
MQPETLNEPVVVFMRPIMSLNSESSLERAANSLRGPFHAIPVVDGKELVGVVTDRTLADALAKGISPYEPVESATTKKFGSILKGETGASALRRFNEGEFDSLLVLDSDQRVLGVLTASDLYPKPVHATKPPLVGGMATPFGVYLTNGAFGVGVKWWALSATGALMFVLFAIGAFLTEPATALFVKWGAQGNADTYASVLPLLTLFIGMRLLPLSGIHAAEHKVVHAIERGEPLVPEVVDRMSRVHPRCGTNLWAGATVFFGILGIPLYDVYTRAVAAIIATLFLWRPLGSATQWLFTTRPPNRKQLEMGIKSGNELLEKYRLVRNAYPNVFQRLWNSGMAYVLLGFAICEGLSAGIAWLFHYNLPF